MWPPPAAAWRAAWPAAPPASGPAAPAGGSAAACLATGGALCVLWRPDVHAATSAGRAPPQRRLLPPGTARRAWPSRCGQVCQQTAVQGAGCPRARARPTPARLLVPLIRLSLVPHLGHIVALPAFPLLQVVRRLRLRDVHLLMADVLFERTPGPLRLHSLHDAGRRAVLPQLRRGNADKYGSARAVRSVEGGEGSAN